MASPLITKLGHGVQLRQADKKILTGLTAMVRTLGPRRDLVMQGRETSLLPVILDGCACRSRLLENGKRQLTALYLPGDICEPFGALPRVMNSTLSTLTSCKVSFVSPAAFRAAAQASPLIDEALWWDLLVAISIDQERLVSLGRRSALERLAHLFCELHVRLQMIGRADSNRYELMITQTDISDLLGLTSVHVNRSIRSLKEAGLISLRGRHLTIHDMGQLREVADFDPSYIECQVQGHVALPNRAFASTLS